MYHFLHKHRYWFVLLVTLTVVALVFFQLQDDPGPGGEPVEAIGGP